MALVLYKKKRSFEKIKKSKDKKPGQENFKEAKKAAFPKTIQPMLYLCHCIGKK
jgi:hypothetical protein